MTTKKHRRLSQLVKPLRYKLMLKPDLEAFTFSGEETIYVVLEKSVKEITLHATELQINSAEWTHKNKEVWAGAISYNEKDETATCTFPKKLEAGKGELKLTFIGILNDKMRGFYRSKFEHEGKALHIAVSQFESTEARRAFPCFDEPAQKAIFDVTLMIPSHMTAISNTVVSNILEHSPGFKVVEFAPTPKMSTYLLAFVVGDFEYIEGKTKDNVLVRVFTTPGKKQQAKFSLDVAIKCLEFYNNYFGIVYPLPVLDMIAIPDFAAGAMENWGAVTYRESSLLIDEDISSTASKQWVAIVVAHELAHQWFGNLVTMEWWTHLWLNEGFASFMQYLAVDHMFPKWDIWTQFVGTEMAEAFSLDALKNTHSIEVEVGHPSEISEIFDQVSYSKGAAVLRMLWQYIGDKDFQKGLQHYLKEYAYANAKTEDLWKALEVVSGKPVTKIMDNWIRHPGHPLITISEHGDKLKLAQSRFFSSPISKKESKDKTIWNIPLILSSRGAVRRGDLPRNDKLLMDKKTLIIDKPQEVEWININSGEGSFVRVDYTLDMLHMLEGAIETGSLSAADRLGLLRDTFDLSQFGQTPTTLALELAQSYIHEKDYTVWATLTTHVSQVQSLVALESFYPLFETYGRHLYRKIAKKMGWKKRPQEEHTDILLRSMVLYKLGSFGDKETITKAQDLFSHSGEQCDSRINSGQVEDAPRGARMTNTIDPDLRGVVYNLVAKNGSTKEFNALLSMYKTEENHQEKDRIGRALGLFREKSLLQRTLVFSLSSHVRNQNTLGVIASVWRNPKGRYLAWEFVKQNWQLLKDRYAGGHYFTQVFGPAGDFTKDTDAKDIEAFVKKHPIPEAARKLSQALEQIYANSHWLDRDKKGIFSFLAKQERTR